MTFYFDNGRRGTFITEYQPFFLTLLAIPIYTVIIFAFMKPFEKMNNDVMQSNAMINSAIIEDINGIETIKSLTSEESRYQKIDSEFVDYLDKTLNLVNIPLCRQHSNKEHNLF